MPRIERIVVRGVTRTFGATSVLRGIDVSFEAGTLTLLEGPNGAGKSTLLALLGTVLTPSAGEISYPPLGDNVAAVRRELGWVAHESHCYRDLSVRANVEFAARVHGVDPGRAWQHACERVDVAPLAERRVGTLSRGQRQRAALARAVAHSPSVLLLDEPWTGLDRRSTEQLEQALMSERERGTLIVVVHHGEGLAERLSARRVRLERGRLAADAPAR